MIFAKRGVSSSFRWSLFLAMALALGGCATISSGSHYDEAVSFDHYKTFGWVADQPLIVAPGDGLPVSALTQKKIVDAIEAEMMRKGFTRANSSEAADLELSYTVGTRERIATSSYPSTYQGAWGEELYGRYYYDADVVHRMYTEGTLGVDIFDAQSRRPVWHGWASKSISTSDRQDPTPSINKAVSALFSDFPPRG